MGFIDKKPVRLTEYNEIVTTGIGVYNEETMQDEFHKNRWYDQDTRISVAVQLLKKFPLEIQTIICEGVSRLAEKDYQANQLMSQFKSLGAERVLAIHKSHLKRRVYDNNAVIYKALNYLHILSDKNRQFIAEQIIELVELIQDYLTLCQKNQQEPDPQQVEDITYTYVEESPEEAKVLLKKIEQEFLKLVDQKINQLGGDKGRDRKKRSDDGTARPDYYS